MSKTPDKKIEKLTKMHKSTKVCKDFYFGAINVLNQTYLPMWTGEEQAGYDARVAQTVFTNMFAPVVDGIIGLVMKKEPETKGFDLLDLENIDLANNDLATMMKSVGKDATHSGICFISAETNKDLNRPYLKKYDYENLYSYKVKDGVLQQIVFKDNIEVDEGEDTFGLVEQERFVVFKIGGGGVWYIKEGDDELKEHDTWENSLKYVPVFAVITGKEISKFEIVPKLYDVANMNKVHLNLETNVANVLGVVGNPVPVFYGNTKEEKVTIGVKEALVFGDRQKEGFEYVEITGQSIGQLQSKVEKVEAQIDKLSFKVLVNDDSKTVVDAEQNRAKNTSFLSDVSIELESKFEMALKACLELANKTVPTDANIEITKDFDEDMVNIETAFKALQSGDMSRQTFYDVLKTGKLPKDFTIEDENSKIERDGV